MRLVTLCEKISSHRFMAIRHLWLYDGNKMGKTSSFSHGIAWTKSYPPTLDNQKTWVNMWNNCFQTYTRQHRTTIPDGRETNKLSFKIVLAFCLEAHSRLQRGSGFQAGHKCFPELKRQTLEIRKFEAAESCRTNFWRGERKKKSSKNMQRVNESLLNINICMYNVKLHEARERMTQELGQELMCG